MHGTEDMPGLYPQQRNSDNRTFFLRIAELMRRVTGDYSPFAFCTPIIREGPLNVQELIVLLLGFVDEWYLLAHSHITELQSKMNVSTTLVAELDTAIHKKRERARKRCLLSYMYVLDCCYRATVESEPDVTEEQRWVARLEIYDLATKYNKAPRHG